MIRLPENIDISLFITICMAETTNNTQNVICLIQTIVIPHTLLEDILFHTMCVLLQQSIHILHIFACGVIQYAFMLLYKTLQL